MSTPKTFVAWLHPEKVDAAFTESLCGLLAYDTIVRPQEGLPRQLSGLRGYPAGVNIATPRNQVVRDFLDHPERGGWLLSIDVDMTFPPDAVEQLLAVADEDEAPIVGGLCFGATDGTIWPTLYELVEEEDGPAFARLSDVPVSGLFRVSATGGAFVMVHRKVFEAVAEQGFNRAYPWYQETELSGHPLGEDLTFMLRAGLCGFPVHVLTSLHVGHVKPTLLSAYRWFKQQGRVIDLPQSEPQPAPKPAPKRAENVAVTRIPDSLDEAALSAAMADFLARNPIGAPQNLVAAAEGVRA